MIESTEPTGMEDDMDDAVAIVGMAGRFPGARTIDQLWSNLKAGVESIVEIPEDRLREAGVSDEDIRDPSYVRATARLDDPDRFDAAFFGIQPQEAALTDPQHRIFLECAWEAVESAGYDTARYPGRIALFGGLAPNTYHQWLLARDPGLVLAAGEYPFIVASEKEAAITRTAYKLGLRGPAVNVQSACSSSGVAVHLACRSLLTGECDMALAGGGRVRVPLDEGYRHVEGIPLSPDGHCRTFDADAAGMVRGSGMCFLVLKRLEDALADGDGIHAVIRGTAINNDAGDRVGFTAPGLRGQAEVIEEALAMADIDPATIGYVEAHGTGTPVGDPIEVSALTRAFRKSTNRTGYCGLGSIKTNIGHLDAGAGVAGIIKAALSVREGTIPPSLHFRQPNPEIDFERSPFRVVTELTEWKNENGHPRRAGVSSFGIGGTNAHIVLEEPPTPTPTDPDDAYTLLPLSARTGPALDAAAERLAARLESDDAPSLGDTAYTLQVGRRRFERRRVVVCRDRDEATRILRTSQEGSGGTDPESPEATPKAIRAIEGSSEAKGTPVAFMFPGGGAQHPGMGADLYAREPVFREALDRCLAALDSDLRDELRSHFAEGEASETDPDLERPSRGLPALFATEYALAQLLCSWGIEPDAMIGHSLGEYAVACIAGVMTPEDAAALVEFRGELFERIPSGVMVSVALSEDDIRSLAPEGVEVAAENLPGRCVVAGTEDGVSGLEARLRKEEVDFRRLHIAAAGHSSLLDPHLDEFRRFLERIELNPPRRPYVSSVTGRWADADEITTPDYWVRHLRQTIRFSAGLEELLRDMDRPLVEVGPGQGLSSLARMHPSRDPNHLVISAMRHPLEEADDGAVLLGALGKLWIAGVDVDWEGFRAGRKRRRIELPTYPFQGERHWLEPRGDASRPFVSEPNTELERPRNTNGDGESMPSPSGEAIGESAPSRVDGADGRHRALSVIREVLSNLSGIAPEALDPQSTFLELGFESLSLTQVSGVLKKVVGVDLSFRDMIETYPTPNALAGHLADRMEGSTEAPKRPEARQERPPTEARPGGGPNAASATPPAEAAGEQGNGSASPGHGPWRPVQADGGGELDDRQTTHVRDLVRRLNGRMPGSKRLTQESRAQLADPRTVEGLRRAWKDLAHPIVVERSRGSRLWDVDGNEWLDVAMGFGSALLGHSPPFVREAVEAQLRQGIEIGPQTPLAGEVAHRICRLTGVERVAFANTGSEAVLAAIRMARTVRARDRIAMFSGSYHGLFDQVLGRGVGREGRHQTVPAAPGIPAKAVEDLLILDYGAQSALETLREEAHNLAAVIVEPVQSRHPDLQPREFLTELRALTRELDIPLILDEMITGFRSHPGGIQALWGIDADLVTYGKALGGGFPIGIVSGKSRFMDTLDGGWWQFGDDSVPETGVTLFVGTFARHPVALAATRAVLSHLEEAGPSLQEELTRRTGELLEEVNDHYERIGVPVRVEHFSSQFRVKFDSRDEWSPLLSYNLRDRGVHIMEGRAAFLSTAHTDEDVATLSRAFRESADAMQQDGFFSARSSAAEEERAGVGSGDLPDPEIEPVEEDEEEIVPLTAGQEEIWLATRMGDEASSAFNLPFGIRLRGPLNEEAMRGALDHLVARHESLRAVFLPDGSGQRFRLGSGIPTTAEDLSGLDADERERRVEELERDEAEVSFDLESGLPVRAKIVRLATDDHLLLLTVHHAVCDGWSSGVLMRELGEIYSALTTGQTPHLPPAPRFRSFVREEQRGRSGSRGKEVDERWTREFSGDLPAVDLPTDRPRRREHDFRADGRVIELDGALHGKLREAANRAGTTSFAYLLAAFEVLLHRLGGQDELIVGVTVAGQPHHGESDLVGHCVSLLPLRARIDGEESFSGQAVATRERLLDALAYQPYTLGTLMKGLRLSRDPGRPPLVAAVFNMDRDATPPVFEGLEAERRTVPLRYTHADVFVNVTPVPSGGLRVEFRYAAGLFDPGTIAAWLDAYTALLREAVRDAERPVDELPVLLDEASERILGLWTDTAVDDGPPVTIPELLQDAMERDPETPAVESPSEDRDRGTLGRAELIAASDRMAGRLRAEGVGPGDRVAILLPRSANMVAALLGVWKAGAAYVPLDPEFPPSRLQFMLEDSGASLILTTSELEDALPDEPATKRLVFDDQDESTPSGDAPGEMSATAAPEDPAYVIYTSGSTGKPKGVEVSHRSVVNFLRSMAREPGMQPGERLLAVTTLTFDISVLELFLPLLTGGTTVIADSETAQDGRRLLSLMRDGGITVMQATPATWRLLVDAGWDGQPAIRVLCGGEALPRELAAELLERGSELWNLYGPTEATVWCTRHRITDADGPILIGRPIENTRAYVLDAHGHPVPVGVPGDLWIGGEQVALGYLNRPELTDERFRSDPFSGEEGDRMYATGDIARWRADGRLECLGRTDHQVKVRGFRIEPGEVEAEIERMEGVRQAVVGTHDDDHGGRRLVAWVSYEPGRELLGSEIRIHLRDHLPHYMVPSLVTEVPEIPLTASGKVDRNSLPDPLLEMGGPEEEFAEPTTSMEQELAGIWRDVLGVPRVGTRDNFFELGGHSLLAMQTLVRMEERTGQRFEPRDMILGTLGQLAAAAEEASQEAESGAGP